MATRDKVAFIHWGAWGDLYVSTAALKDVVDEFPSTPIYVVGSAKWTQILHPGSWTSVKGIIASDDGRTGELFLSENGLWTSSQKNISLRLFFRSVRASFNLRTESFRYAWAPLLAGVPRRHGSAPGLWARLFYTHRSPWLGKDPVIHERDRMLQVIEAPSHIGERARVWSESVGLPKLKIADRVRAEELTHAKFGSYWLINPTASRREKAWPSEKFNELFSRLEPLLAEQKIELRILGAPNETEWLKEVISIDKIVQPPTILDLLDVLSGARVLIANTSSVQFLAPGTGVQTITLMGRSDPKIWGPLGPKDIVIRGVSTPQPDIFAEEREAYRSITVARVLSECEKLLEAHENEGG